jgi:hypothetical protein
MEAALLDIRVQRVSWHYSFFGHDAKACRYHAFTMEEKWGLGRDRRLGVRPHARNEVSYLLRQGEF